MYSSLYKTVLHVLRKAQKANKRKAFCLFCINLSGLKIFCATDNKISKSIIEEEDPNNESSQNKNCS